VRNSFPRVVRSALLAVLLAAGPIASIAISAQQAPPATTTAPATTAPADTTTTTGTPPAGRGRGGPVTPATEPRPRDDARHQSFVETAKAGNIDLLFVGDSITDWWLRPGPARGRAVWDEHFAPLKAANFGIAGDTTQGVLWRMRNGELEGFSAKLIVLMLGTNNVARNPPLEIAEGNRLIVEEFRKQQPQAKVLILGVFPRGQQPDTSMRGTIGAINDKLATFADNKQVFYLDIGSKFLGADGTLSPDIFPDGLHPNEAGYRIWADAIVPTVKELMK
jgi:lysophospholipase L1-like esterase